MQLFNSVFLISLLSTVSALAPRSSVNGPCTGAGGAPGVCIATASCSSGGGSFISNACPGTADDIKCCVKTSCASGGSCKWTSQCGGTTQAGLCPGPSDFKCCLPTSGSGSGTLPGLNSVQTRNARAIIARAKVDFAASQQKRACYVAITTAFQESSIRILANSNYADSLNYPHDGVGSDHDSVGIFQQRASWGSTKDRMNADLSAHFFFNALKKVASWDTIAIGVAAQKVQVSAFPDAYNKWVAKAEAVCDAGF